MISSNMEPFPEDVWNEIREYPGNHKCCDCPSLDSDWGSVSHGTLICLECAGKHRSLGVHVSFVRSIRMDSWSKEQIEMMKQGGNDQIRRFFKKLEIENSPIQTLYCSKGANHYRERLKERVDKIMKGEIKSEKRVVPGKSQMPKLVQHIEEVKLVPTSHGDTLTIVFKDGPMGMTLTKDYKDMAVVSKLVPGGAAQCSGVLVGDTVIGISGKAIENYDEIMHMIPCMNRPLTIKFVRKSVQKHNPAAVHPSRSEPSLTHSAMNSAFADGYKQPGDGQKSGSSSRSNSKDNLPASAGPPTPPGPTVRTKTSSTVKVKSSGGAGGGAARLVRANSLSDGEETVVSNASILKKSPRGFDKARLKTTGGGGGAAASAGTTGGSPGPHSGSSGPASPQSGAEGSPVHHTASDIKKKLSFNSKENLAEDDSVGPPEADVSSRSQAHSEALENQINEELFDGADEEEQDEDDEDENNEEEEEEGGEDEDEEESEEDEEPKKFVLEPGVIVKVLVEDRWRSAVIKRKHKDGTFKVLFRDDTSESHVPVSRMALPTSRAAEVVPGLALDTDRVNRRHSQDEEEDEEEDETNYPDIISPDPHHNNNSNSSSSSGYYAAAAASQPALEDEGEFIVGISEVDLDSFLEEESSPVAIIHNGAGGGRKNKQLSPTRPGTGSTNSSGGSSGANSSKTQGIGSKANEVDAATAAAITAGTAGKGETNVVKEIVVTFERPPLGLTLTANAQGEPEISKVVEGGQASEKGLQVGDVLMLINSLPASVYEIAMRILPTCAYPLDLKFRRGSVKSILERSSEVLLKNSMDLANRIKESITTLPGLSKTSIMSAPYSERLSNSHREKVSAVEKKATVPATTVAVTSRFLPRTPANSNEVDVEFTEPELGFRLEEYISHETYSVVTHITDNGAAKNLGVKLGWILLGINFEKYISHAHSVATLKYAKRPVTIRFKTK